MNTSIVIPHFDYTTAQLEFELTAILQSNVSATKPQGLPTNNHSKETLIGYY